MNGGREGSSKVESAGRNGGERASVLTKIRFVDEAEASREVREEGRGGRGEGILLLSLLGVTKRKEGNPSPPWFSHSTSRLTAACPLMKLVMLKLMLAKERGCKERSRAEAGEKREREEEVGG